MSYLAFHIAYYYSRDTIKLILSNNQIRHLTSNQFATLANLKWLNLSNNQIKELAPEQFSSLVNLQGLDLSNNRIKSLTQNQFTSLVNLESLILSNNQIKVLAKNQFSTLVKLEWLFLSSNQIEQLDENSFKELKNLYMLDISCNQLKDSTFVSSLRQIELTDLNLFNNKLENFSFENNSLEKLDLSCNNVSKFNFKGTNLVYLRLNNNKIHSFDMAKYPKLKSCYLHENLLENVNPKLLDSKHLKTFTVYNCKLLDRNLSEIEGHFQANIDLRIREPNLRTLKGHIQSIDISKKRGGEFPQLASFSWPEIPMFAVLTGKNGSGKSSLLKFINQRLEDFYKSSRRPSKLELSFTDSFIKITPLTLKINDKIETFGNSSFFAEYLEKDEEYAFNKSEAYDMYNISEIKKPIESKNKANIYTFRTIEACLNYLRNDLENVSVFLKEKVEFKYKIIQAEYHEEKSLFLFRMLKRDSDRVGVSIEDLSPGEHLILLLLLWQYIFGKYEVYGRPILLFDEPDAHLHPSAVSSFLKILKKLARMGVQIMMSTHSPTTASYIDEENIFLLYTNETDENDSCLKILKGTSPFDISWHLTSNILRIETPCKNLYVEGKDSSFYKAIIKYLNEKKFFKCPSRYKLLIQPFVKGHQNKDTLIKTVEALGEANSRCYGIVDDDGDRDCNKMKHLRNLLYLKRDGKESYALDPINVYFYLKCITTKKANVLNLIKDIEQKIGEIDPVYKEFGLNSILELVYSSKPKKDKLNCIKILQVIVDTFFETLKKEAVTTIVEKELNVLKLFKLPLSLAEATFKNNFKRSEALDILKNAIFDEIKQLNENLQKIYFSNNWSSLLENSSTPSATLNENFDLFLEAYKNIGNEPPVNFDLDKCDCEENICDIKKSYLEKNIRIGSKEATSAKNKNTPLANYFKLKKLANKVEQYQRYYNFQEIDITNEKSMRKRIEEVLSEERKVYVNGFCLKYPNLFISFDDHNFESLLNKVFTNCNIKCDKIIEKLGTKGLFIPDDMVSMFRTLCTNVHELNEETFKFFVTDENVPHKLNLFTDVRGKRDTKLVYFNNKKCKESPEITTFNQNTILAYCKSKLNLYENT